MNYLKIALHSNRSPSRSFERLVFQQTFSYIHFVPEESLTRYVLHCFKKRCGWKKRVQAQASNSSDSRPTYLSCCHEIYGVSMRLAEGFFESYRLESSQSH